MLGVLLVVSASLVLSSPLVAKASSFTASVSGTGTTTSSSGSYTFDYTTDSALSVGDAVYLGLSGAGVLSSTPTDLTVQDATYSTQLTITNSSYDTSGGSLEIDLGTAVSAGDSLAIAFTGNALTAGTYQITGWNSVSGTSAHASGSLSVTSASAVQNVTASASNPVQGEFSSFTASFTTTTLLPAGGTISLTLPVSNLQSTSPPPASDISVTANGTSVPIGAPSVDSQGDLVVPVSAEIAAGAAVTVVAGVHQDLQIDANLGSAAPVTVWTSADTAQVSSQPVSLATSGGTAVTNASVTPSTLGESAASSAIFTPYTVTFTPATTVSGSVYGVHVTGIPFNAGVPTVTVAQSGQTYAPTYVSVLNGILTVDVTQRLAAGTPVTVTVGSLDGNYLFDPMNPQASSVGPFTVSTDADASAVTAPAVNLETAPQVSGSLSDPVTGQADTVFVMLTVPTSGSTATIDLSQSGMTWAGSSASNPPSIVAADGGNATPLASGTYTLSAQNVLTLDSSAFASATPGQTVTIDLPLENGAVGTGAISVSTSDTGAPAIFGFNIVPLPTLTLSSTTAGAADTLTFSFQMPDAEQYVAGVQTANLYFDITSLVQAGVSLAAQTPVTLTVGGQPSSYTADVTGVEMIVNATENLLAGQTDTLSFQITNPSYLSADLGVNGAAADPVQVGQANFSGTVEDLAGSPVPNAVLQLTDVTNPSAIVPTIIANSEGAFAYQLGSDTYVVTGFQDPANEAFYNLLSPVTVNATQSAATNLVVQASPANVSGQLTTPSGISPGGVDIYAVNSEGLVETLVTGASGAISGTLSPGTWTISNLYGATTSVNLDPAATVTVPSSGTATLDLTWPQTDVSLKVTQGGTATEYAWVEIAPYANGQADLSQAQWLGPSDQTGLVTGYLPTGSYQAIMAQVPSAGESITSVDLTSSAIMVNVPTTSAVAVSLPTPNLAIDLSQGGLQDSLAYAYVEVAPDNGSGAPNLSQAQWLQADQNGNVRAMVASTPSTWWVLAIQTADGENFANFASSPVQLTLGTTLPIAWPAAVTVTLDTTGDTPIANTQVTLAPVGTTPGTWTTVQTGSDGSFAFDGAAGTWQVMSYGSVNLEGLQATYTFQVPQTPGGTVTVNVPAASVQGQVLDASGQAVANSWVVFAPLQSGSPDWAASVGTSTDAQGNYTAVLSAGTWQAMGYWDQATSTWVDLSQDGLDVTVASGQTAPQTYNVQPPQPNVAGTATGPSGTALANGTVVFFDASGMGVALQTNAAGQFSGYLPSGTWSVGLLISASGAQDYVQNPTQFTPPATSLSLVWPVPNVSGQVTDASGKGIPQAVLFFAPASSTSDTSTWVEAVADNDGNYAVQLGQGSWQLVGIWTGQSFLNVSQDISVPASGVITENVAGTEIALGSSGANAIVEVQPSGGGNPLYFQADQSGNVSAELLAGTYTVTGFWSPSGAFSSADQPLSVPGTGTVQVSATAATPLQIELSGSAPTSSVDVLIENTATSQQAWYATNASGQIAGLPDGSYEVLEVATSTGSTTQPTSPVPFQISGGSASGPVNVQ